MNVFAIVSGICYDSCFLMRYRLVCRTVAAVAFVQYVVAVKAFFFPGQKLPTLLWQNSICFPYVSNATNSKAFVVVFDICLLLLNKVVLVLYQFSTVCRITTVFMLLQLQKSFSQQKKYRHSLKTSILLFQSNNTNSKAFVVVFDCRLFLTLLGDGVMMLKPLSINAINFAAAEVFFSSKSPD